MPKRPSHLIEFSGGGPLDGAERAFITVPEEVTHEGHSYCFHPVMWQFIYVGRWRVLDLGRSLLTYRTYGEALRQLGQLQLVGAISASESLEIQARIKQTLRTFDLDPKD